MRHLLVTTFLLVSAVTALAAGSGTGFFVSTSGHILTNAHVIDGAENILIQTGAGEKSMARVLSVDASNDLALIKIEAQSKPLHIRSTEGLDKSAKVFTIGFSNPGLQGLEAKYTEGVISSVVAGRKLSHQIWIGADTLVLHPLQAGDGVHRAHLLNSADL